MQTSNSQFILFKTEDEKISVDVRFENETVWLTQDQIAMLFGVERSGITQHIKNIFSEGELQEESVSKKFLRTAADGKPPTKAILRSPPGLPTFVATKLIQRNGITKEKTGPGGNVPFVGTVRIGRVEPPIILRRTWFGAAHL